VVEHRLEEGRVGESKAAETPAAKRNQGRGSGRVVQKVAWGLSGPQLEPYPPPKP